MADLGATFTDAEIIATEKELKAVYNKAYKDILQKQKEFNAKYAEKEAKKLQQVASGQMTQDEFDAWKAGQVFQGKQWENKKKQILGTIYKTNDIATGIVNGKTSGIFAFNANYTAYGLEHGAGCNFGFGIYDETTVVNLIKNNPQLLPEWKIDQPKDYTWNQKKLNRQINLGIIEGESLDKIANRLSESLVSQNFNKMQTFARTAMTGAQNAGRQIRLDEAKKLGINVKKEWMATLDAHTRMTHRKLDGQKVDTDKSFDINGMSIRFPGDPLAPAALVYNCRCTMVGDLVNYPSTYDRYDNINGKRIKGMTYNEWEEAKNSIEKNIFNVVNGKNILKSWTRRSDQFDFEIEDVINAQGFDGLPRVVSAEEFDKLVKQANGGNGFIAQRTYSAPNQEILDAYRDQLYTGKWYVDCSTGGAQYGQGMYCAADYTGKLSSGIRTEMDHYIELQDGRLGYNQSQAIVDAQYKYAEEQRQKILNSVEGEKEQAMFRREFLHTGTREDRSLLKSLSDDEYDEMFDKLALIKERADKAYRDAANLSREEIASMFNIPEHAPNYVETFTLDQSAKIIKYSDARTEIIANHAKTLYNLTEGEFDTIKEIGMKKGADFRKAITDLKSENPNLYNAYQNSRDWLNEAIADETIDMGAEVTKLGYDAINAEGHGESGSYTVILNRTKVIFKGK